MLYVSGPWWWIGSAVGMYLGRGVNTVILWSKVCCSEIGVSNFTHQRSTVSLHLSQCAEIKLFYWSFTRIIECIYLTTYHQVGIYIHHLDLYFFTRHWIVNTHCVGWKIGEHLGYVIVPENYHSLLFFYSARLLVLSVSRAFGTEYFKLYSCSLSIYRFCLLCMK